MRTQARWLVSFQNASLRHCYLEGHDSTRNHNCPKALRFTVYASARRLRFEEAVACKKILEYRCYGLVLTLWVASLQLNCID